MSFQQHHRKFNEVVGSKGTNTLLLQEDFAFAHEAGVYLDDRQELYITSNRLTAEDNSQSVQISCIKLNGSVTRESLDCGDISMANGGTKYKDGILFCAQGYHNSPSGLYFYRPTVLGAQLLISEFHGRPFNSVNDVVVHSDGSIWFTDPTYGYEQGYRPAPRLPSQVYRFHPEDQSMRAMADGFGHPNGICFSPDEKIVYVTDTDWINGKGITDDTKVSAIYAFDVSSYGGEPFLTNRRLFAMCDTGIPDGIKCDTDGNVYSGCGDGLNIWSPGGLLLGKILLEGGVANFCFGKEDELYLLNEDKLWHVRLGSGKRGAFSRI